MRRGCKRILRWAVIGLIIFFCIIPLVIALFQEATGIVVLPTEEALPTVAMLASATNSPEPTETDMATKTMTPTPLPSATASATLTLLSTATFTPTAAHTSTQTAIPTTMPTIDPKADFDQFSKNYVFYKNPDFYRAAAAAARPFLINIRGPGGPSPLLPRCFPAPPGPMHGAHFL